MTDPQWVLHGPGKHDRTVCDTAETWARLFIVIWGGHATNDRFDVVESFTARNITTLREVATRLGNTLQAEFLLNMAALGIDENA